jgi:multidrug efflux pump subunit AcrA (membrane-fusion protein)
VLRAADELMQISRTEGEMVLELKVNPKLAEVALKPGMTATVDIRTGRRSVLKYLAKPVYTAFAGAMNER